MTVKTREEYDKVLEATWFVDERPPDQITYVSEHPPRLSTRLTSCRFPAVFPFSKMYPLCCIDIRNFAEQFLVFTRENFDHPSVVDETLRKACRSSRRL
jgi:hypothetical protein